MTAVVLIAHGSRRPEANADLDVLADALRAEFQLVQTAYLELAEPTIPTAVQACVSAGAKRIILMPYFLSPGVHVTDDLENLRVEFAKQYPEVTFQLAAPLGRHPLLVEIVRQRIREIAGAFLFSLPSLALQGGVGGG